MRKLQTVVGLGASALGLAGLCIGVRGVLNIKPSEPKLENYALWDGMTADGCVIEDYDHDGDADLIRTTGQGEFSRSILYVAPDMAEQLKGYLDLDRSRTTPRMTLMMQDLATQVMQIQKGLAYQIDKERYDSFQKNQKE